MAHLPPFDPNAEFKAALNMRFAGHAILKGSPIDKSQLGDDPDYRDRQLKLLYENHRITAMTSDEVEATVPDLTAEQTARIAELMNSNSRSDLDKLAAGEPFHVPSPEKLPSKEAVASAIVRAEAGGTAA